MNIEEQIKDNFNNLKQINLPKEFHTELKNLATIYNDELMNQMKQLEWKLQSSQQFTKIVDEIWKLYITYDEKFMNEVKQLVKEYLNIKLEDLPYMDIFNDNRLNYRYHSASKQIIRILSNE
jgi:hypothetical protein